MKMLKDYPNLPMLPPKRALRVLTTAGITVTVQAALLSVARISLYRWHENPDMMRVATHEQVSVLAYRALRALRHRALPAGARADTDTIRRILFDDGSYEGRTLSDYAPEELLPRQWLDQLTASEASNATA